MNLCYPTYFRRCTRLAWALLLGISLAGCWGSTSTDEQPDAGEDGTPAGATYRVGFVISGLPAGEEVLVELADLTPPVAGTPNTSAAQSISASNGRTFFSNPVPDGTAFAVHPNMAGESSRLRCDVVNDRLRTIAGSDITDIEIRCVEGHLLGGAIQGLRGADFFLQLTIAPYGRTVSERFSADGPFAFSKAVATGESYQVTVSQPPTNPDQVCRVDNEAGVMGDADVTNIQVTCAEASIGYNVTGLSGSGLIVSLALEVEVNGVRSFLVVERGDVTEDGEFTFDTPVNRGEEYHVAVYQQPSDPDQECTVPAGIGTVDADLTMVEVRGPQPDRVYQFYDNNTVTSGAPPLYAGRKLGGVLEDSFVFGPGPIIPLGNVVSGLATTELFQLQLDNADADGVVFSNLTGTTYWLAAESPRPNLDPTEAASRLNSHYAQLDTYWRFRKVTPGATFQLVLSDINLLAYHDVHQAGSGGVLIAEADLRVDAYRAYVSTYEEEPFYSAASDIELRGNEQRDPNNPFHGNVWSLQSRTLATTDFSIFSADDFRFNGDAGVAGYANGHVATAQLVAPKVIDVDLSKLVVGAEFVVVSSAIVHARNSYSAEGGAVAYLRDPAAFDPGENPGGISIETQGLVMLELGDVDIENLQSGGGAAPAACPVAVTDRSVLEFSAAHYRVSEAAEVLDAINVTRSGNASGLVTARVSLAGGTATIDTDFEMRELEVRFGDGSTAPRTLELPILADELDEGDETLTLTLESPGGCAVIGARNTATVTIVDDDAPIASGFLQISGTVSGLVGSGLTLSNIGSSTLAITANGPFAFPRETPDRISYAVQVASQPVNPGQSCTVTNGTGRLAGADITNVLVACTTLPPDAAGLDLQFASGGKLSDATLGEARDVAVQADGKILVVTKTTLARFLANGSPDTSFGTAGQAASNFFGASDALEAVAVQPDGYILVAGSSQDGANSPTQNDVVVARYDTNGLLDPNFGSGGKVVTDIAGRGDGAYDILLLPDGRVVVTGTASIVDSFGITNGDFVAIRYTSSGVLDTSFGTGGFVTTNIAGRTDLGYAAALQLDGKIVLAGRVANTGGDDPDIGLVRYTASGALDTSFGTGGIVRVLTSDWDEAADVAIQPDGKIVIAGFRLGSTSATPDRLTVMRFDGNGNADPGFGTNGRVDDPVMTRGRGIALQTDGRIVVVGGVGEFPSDISVARLNAIGALDTSFGTGGALRVDFFGGSDDAFAVAIQADGKIVAAGVAQNGTQATMGLIRVLP